MAKLTRRVVASVCRPKDTGKAPYLKIRDHITLAAGSTLRLESKKSQLESLAAAVTAGKVSPDMGETIKERINKIPEYVLFEVVQLTEKE